MWCDFLFVLCAELRNYLMHVCMDYVLCMYVMCVCVHVMFVCVCVCYCDAHPELRNLPTMKFVVLVVVILCSLLYGFTGTFGYLTFLKTTVREIVKK